MVESKKQIVVDVDVRKMIEEEESEYQHHLKTKPWLFQAGKSGNPAGRPKGKTMKEWMRDYLASLTDEERLEYFQGIPKVDVWRMAEGNPTEDKNIKVTVPVPILGGASQAITLLEEADTGAIEENNTP